MEDAENFFAAGNGADEPSVDAEVADDIDVIREKLFKLAEDGEIKRKPPQ